MSTATPTFAEVLEPYVRGKGVQFFTTSPVPFTDIPVQTTSIVENCADASLDFVIAGPEWLLGDIPFTLISEWRRVLNEGGKIAVIVEACGMPVQLLARLLAREAGLAVDNPIPIGETHFLLTGIRSFNTAMLMATENLGRELSRAAKPAGWEEEFNFGIGSLLLNAGDGQNAATFYNLVLTENTQNLDAKIGLALALGVQGNWQGAEGALNEVLGVDPENTMAKEWLVRFQKNLLRPAPTPQQQKSQPEVTRTGTLPTP